MVPGVEKEKMKEMMVHHIITSCIVQRIANFFKVRLSRGHIILASSVTGRSSKPPVGTLLISETNPNSLSVPRKLTVRLFFISVVLR